MAFQFKIDYDFSKLLPFIDMHKYYIKNESWKFTKSIFEETCNEIGP